MVLSYPCVSQYQGWHLRNKIGFQERNLLDICVTAAGWRAGNTQLNFVRPELNPVRARAGLLWLPGLLR